MISYGRIYVKYFPKETVVAHVGIQWSDSSTLEKLIEIAHWSSYKVIAYLVVLQSPSTPEPI